MSQFLDVKVTWKPNSITSEDTKRLIELMQSSEAVFDRKHFHSFQPISMILLPFHSCLGCGERLQSSFWGSSQTLRCVACGSYSHRSCAFSESLEWKTKCRVNFKNACTEDNNKKQEEIQQPQQNLTMNSSLSEVSNKTEAASFDKERKSSIIHSSSDLSLVDDYKSPKVSSPNYEDGALEGDKQVRLTASTQHAKANCPCASLIDTMKQSSNHHPCHTKHSIDTEQSRPWTESIQSLPSILGDEVEMKKSVLNGPDLSPHTTHENSDDCYDYLWKPSGPAPHWSSEEFLAAISEEVHQIKNLKNSDSKDEKIRNSGALHFASGFRVVSEALHEHILATFRRRVKHKDTSEATDDTKVKHLASENINSCPDKPLLMEASDVCPSLDESNPIHKNDADNKRLGIWYIAGGVAGGVAGLVLAGPAGGLMGIKFCQLGAIGMLLEGSFTVGALAGGVAAGQNIVKHFDDKIRDSRVLALGEGSQRQVILLIRPSIQPEDDAWDEIYQNAKSTFAGNRQSVTRWIPGEARAAKRDRYERDGDIVAVEESELRTSDKVLLLVSRILTNKESLPGHVYRHLIESYRARAQGDLQEARESARKPGTTESDASLKTPTNNCNDLERQPMRSTRRRQDAHAVIKYVTAALLETRPGFGVSAPITEMTASAVESLVFGEVYDLVIGEIEAEKDSIDKMLSRKIASYEHRVKMDSLDQRQEGTHDNLSDAVSKKALNALHGLPQAHSAVDKLQYCVSFLETISSQFSSNGSHGIGADALLPIVCRHVVAAKVDGINAQLTFLEEFARDEQLLRGREGYALVTLQASLHYLNSSTNFEEDIFFSRNVSS